MEGIKKKLATLKEEKELAIEKSEEAIMEKKKVEDECEEVS